MAAFNCGGPLFVPALSRKTSLARLPIIVIVLTLILCAVWCIFESSLAWPAALAISLYP